MPTEVLMPQMGESIAEGTIVRWIKQIGDPVTRDEPLFEISTDKVDAEIPAPAAGVLTEIRVPEGETVPVNSVVALIGQEGDEPVAPPTAAQVPAAQLPGASGSIAPASPTSGAGPRTRDERRRQTSSPLVRKIAREHGIDLTSVGGTGIGGRVTKRDILAHLERSPDAARTGVAGEQVEVVPMSVMRRQIAERMVLSRRTSAHVHSVFEVDFSRVAAIRAARKAEFERSGATLTYLSFIARSVADALRATPIVNASIDGGNVIHHKAINLGIAVALDWGLIVPVVKRADALSLLDLSRAISDLADRARRKQLKPEEVQGGTFTITNPGGFGALFGMPIINQPQVAILGVGAIEKRPVVVDDAIAVRLRGYLTLGYDHRLIDGAVADQFMARIKQRIEGCEDEGA